MESTRTYSPKLVANTPAMPPVPSFAAKPEADRTAAGKPRSNFLQQRLVSLDVYRGLIMVTLAFTGFGLAKTARNYLKAEPDSTVWQQVFHHFEHVEWVGCGYWDLIQPSFMFMVGVAMAFSYTRRREQGATYGQMFRHALVRSVVLIFLGIFLISNGQPSTVWSLMNVLTQIGLGYTFLFLLWGRPAWLQMLAAVLLLGGTWGLYEAYAHEHPEATIDLATGAPELGVTAKWAQENLQGVRPGWQKNANVGHAIDVWLLNQLPQDKPFEFNRGGYQTINFIPELATMIFGLMCGELLRSRSSAMVKFLVLLAAGAVGLAAGLALHETGICPVVKRIWTPSWTLYSTGWCCLILAGLYLVVDVLRWRWWTFPLVVVGVNSIAIYCMGMLLPKWTAATLKTHFGPDIFTDFGWGNIPPEFLPTVEACLIGLVFWLLCLWMYRQKIFVRI